MKKIQDIKKRSKVKAQALHEDSWLDNFWRGQRMEPVRKRKQQKIFITGKKLLAATLLIALTMLATGRAYVVKAELSDSARDAKLYLENSLTLLNEGKYDQALLECGKAKNEIGKIKINLQSWGQNSQYLKMIDYRSDIVSVEMLVSAVDQVLDIAASTKSLIEEFSEGMSSSKIQPGEDLNYRIDIDKLLRYLDNKSAQIKEIQEQISKHKPAGNIVSPEDQKNIAAAFELLSQEISGVKENIIPLLTWYLGGMNGKKIMLLLQNNAEIRGSGGFIGSYAILSTKASSINRIDFQTNIYKLDNAVKDKLNIPAPPEYDVLSGGKMYLRDANYAVDGPESFREVIRLYKLESGQDLDGIIAIDTSFVTSLLSITGPIDLPQYNLKVTADNFLNEVQTEVEQNYFTREGAKAENEPKKILSEMLPIMLSQILDKMKLPEYRSQIINSLKESIAAKHLLFYADQSDIERKLQDLNLAGKIASGDFDYFFSHSTNIGGGKSSLNIEEKVDDSITLGTDGSVSHQVVIERNHQGTGVWPDNANINLMRILIPGNSNITLFKPELGNFWPHMDKKRSKEIDHYTGEESGKDKLSFWMNTNPGFRSRVSFGYNSSYKVEIAEGKSKYKLFLQKQAGSRAAHYHITIKYPENWNFTANYVHSDLVYDLDLDKDKILEIPFQL